MKQWRRWAILGGLLLVCAAVGVVVYQARPSAPALLRGDAWDYGLQAGDVPADWAVAENGIITAHDLAQEKLEAGTAVTGSVPITPSASLEGMTHLYYVTYQLPDSSDYGDFTYQVILYPTTAAAKAALASENPGAEWDSAPAPALGDEVHLWRFRNDPAVGENLYRVDFRYLNGIGSATLLGTAKAVQPADAALGYAQKILEKMKAGTTPDELKRLQSARLPDLRQLLLTQDQLTKADPPLGGRWQIASQQLPGWTPTSSMSAGAQQALAPLGRITGYQMFGFKSVTAAEYHSTYAILFFQQVTAYAQAGNAQKALDMMKGVEQLPEAANPPQIGGGPAHAWRGELSTTLGSDKATVAVSELDFRVGNYVASIRLQSRPLDASETSSANINTKNATIGKGLLDVTQLTEALAKLLADNLQKAHS